MSLYLEEQPNYFVRWAGGQLGEYNYPAEIEYTETAEWLAERSLYIPVVPDVPEGERVISEVVMWVDGVVTLVYTTEPIPTPVLTRIPKDAIWRRATDAEAETMETLLSQQPVRIRRIYDGATYVMTTDELYPTLLAALVEAFGEERALELLEPVE